MNRLTFTCLKSTIETLGKGAKRQNDVSGVVLVFLLLTLNIFCTFLNIFIVDFEHVNVSWVSLNDVLSNL